MESKLGYMSAEVCWDPVSAYKRSVGKKMCPRVDYSLHFHENEAPLPAHQNISPLKTPTSEEMTLMFHQLTSFSLSFNFLISVLQNIKPL